MNKYAVHVAMKIATMGYFLVEADTPEAALEEYNTNILPKIPPNYSDVTVVDVVEHNNDEQEVEETTANEVKH